MTTMTGVRAAPVVSRPQDQTERQADSVADEVARGLRVHHVGFQAPATAGAPADGAVPPGRGSPLPAADRALMQARFGRDFSSVRLHTDPARAAALDAVAYTVGTHVVLAPGQYRPGTSDGQRLLAHELAHVLQQRGRPAATVVHRQTRTTPTPTAPPATFADIPPAERAALHVVTSPVPEPGDLPGLFAATPAAGGGATVTNPVPVPVRIAPGVPAGLQHGLANIAGFLTTGTTPALLTANSTLIIALTLPGPPPTPTTLRFTWHGHPGAAEILVERLAASVAPTAPALSPLAPGSALTTRLAAFSITVTGWSNAELLDLQAAITSVPDADLSRVQGLRITRAPNPPTSLAPSRFGEDAGRYDSDNHTITVFDRAFGASTTRFGAGLTTAAQTLLHEMGHAVDLQPLRAAESSRAAREQVARQNLDAAFGTFGSPSSGYSGFPQSRQNDFNRLDAAVAASTRSDTRVRSASGSRTTATGDRVRTLPAREVNAFRTAVASDGRTPLTDYSQADTEESFAEAYSLYRADPVAFRTLRPALSAYFSTRFP